MDEKDKSTKSDGLEKSTEAVEEIYDASFENFSATSFSELMTPAPDDPLENVLDLSEALRNIIYNIMYSNPELTQEDKIAKAITATKDFSSLCEMALSMEDEKPTNPLIDAIKSLFKGKRSRGCKKKEESTEYSGKESNGNLMVFKDNLGKFRWIASYSNAYRDEDYPPEIISEKSHKRFVDMVDKGLAPFPELWHWHIPGTRWGVADFVAYDEENGIALASGTVDEGHEKEAELLMASETPIALSHGMPKSSIVRDPDDNSVIVEHITREISDLPRLAAANKLTEFQILTEDKEMGIPDKKKEYLVQLGVSQERISAIESSLANVAKSATDAGIERKEKTEEEVPAPVTPPVETPPVPEATPVTEAVESEKESKYATKEEIADVLFEALSKNTKEVLDALSAIDKRLTAVEEKSADPTPSWTPTGSLMALMAQKMSAIGDDSTTIRKDNKLVKGPEESKETKDAQGAKVGWQPLDDVLNRIANNGGR